MKPLVVVALGGNMILQKGQKPSIATQQKNVVRSLRSLIPLFKKYRVILTHGNGPQVGNILVRVEEAVGKAYKLPLDVCVAESEGEMGYVITLGLYEVLRDIGINKHVVSILTEVLVDKKDQGFRNPTKPVGPYLSARAANKLKKQGKDVVKTVKGYRRVVASPRPVKILETEMIKKLITKDTIVIATGGGGIPVIENKGKYVGVEAVIDKDLASACLAKSLGADMLVMLTDINSVYINYGKKGQKRLGKISVKELEKYKREGHFPAGSMGPKVEAGISFLEKGKKSIVTDPKTLQKALAWKGGTIITK